MVDGVLSAGTDRGLFLQSTGNSWALNPTYPQAIYDYQTGPWGSGTYEAFGKQDGLAFIVPNSSGGFTSDHFDALDGKRVYGIFYGKYITISVSADGTATETKHDALYLCTELGLFGVASGNRGGQYSSMLAGREMFGSLPLVATTLLPSGGTATVPVKIYKIFQSLPINSLHPTVPINILTSNGMYKVRNWRWCDPTVPDSAPTTDASGNPITGNQVSDFALEAHSLTGISCYNYVATLDTSGLAPVQKNWVGTSCGVYRSFNDGASWDKCERMGGNDLAVYDIQYLSGALLAGTSDGFWCSDDEGDTWGRPGDTGESVTFNPSVTSGVPFSTTLAQTFIPQSGQVSVNKLSAYLSVSIPVGLSTSQIAAVQGNYLTASVFACDGNGFPTTAIASSSTHLLASLMSYPGFQSFPISATLPDSTSHYAVVLQEVPAGGAGGACVFQWHQSTQSNPYAGGQALTSVSGSSGTWTAEPGQDFYFRAFFQAPVTPTLTQINANFQDGNGHGVLVNDAGALTTDSKLALVLVVDDSHSASWADPNNTRISAIPSLFSTLFGRTITSLTGGQTNYCPSFADFWEYGISEIERTSGFSNNVTELSLDSSALYSRGLTSALYDCANIAVSGLNQQSIVDAIIRVSDPIGNATRVGKVVQYLQDRTLLRLSDVITYWNALPAPKSGWDSTAANICNYDDVSQFVVSRWAKSFTPASIIISDGDDDASGSAISVSQTAQSAWGGVGVAVQTFGVGRSHDESGIRTISALTGGRHFDISNEPSDWGIAIASLLHGAPNNLFVSSWATDYDFSEPTWVQALHADYIIPSVQSGGVQASCIVSAQWTTDRINWTSLQVLTSGADFIVSDLLFGLRFTVTMTDGWTGSAPAKPSLTALYHTEVTPSRQYLVTQPQASSGMLFEYLLSAAADLPKSARIAWGIVRGNSTDFADFEKIRNGRKGALPNRQNSLQFTKLITQSGLTTTTRDYKVYQVVGQDGLPALWSTVDQVSVVSGSVILDPVRASFALDGSRGLVYFSNSQPNTVVFTVNIVTPPKLYVSVGEPTTTTDNKIYYLANGRWPNDAEAIVIVNGQIKRGGFLLSPNEGVVTFAKERERTDIITVYIQNSSFFRVGVEISNYSTSPVTLDNFGLYYTTQTNGSLLYKFHSTPTPEITGNIVNLSPLHPTLSDRLQVSYVFRSIDGNAESGTQIIWHRIRGGNDVVLDGTNSTTNYSNRITERKIDLVGTGGLFVAGDQVYVVVSPSDGFNTGLPVTSNKATIISTHKPYVTNLQIDSTPPIKTDQSGVYHASVKAPLTAFYGWNSQDSAVDHSVVTWYEKDNLSIPYYVGVIIPVNFTQVGQVLNFTVEPFDSNLRGTLQTSYYVVIG